MVVVLETMEEQVVMEVMREEQVGKEVVVDLVSGQLTLHFWTAIQ